MLRRISVPLTVTTKDETLEMTVPLKRGCAIVRLLPR